MKIYEVIKQIAASKGISVYRIERDLGLGNGAISKWNASTPTVDNLYKVAKYLEITVEELLSNSTSS